MNIRQATHEPIFQSLLLGVQALGTAAIQALFSLIRENGMLRQLPLLRIAAILSLVILCLQSDLNLTIHVGTPSTGASEASTEQAIDEPPARTLLAGIFSSESASVESHPKIDDATALSLIERFGSVARSEQKRFGIPANVLLAAAAVSSTDVAARNSNNYFSKALDGTFKTPWESWRAMSLTIVAQSQGSKARTQRDWIAIVANLYPDPSFQARSIEFALERYTL